MILLCFLALLCGTWTSKNKHLYFPLHDALLKLNILYFLILLHILPARIVLYIPILLHILPVPIVLYFFLDNFIIFLAFHVKVALPKINIYTFLSSPCVLPRVTGHTSLILRMILSFLQPFARTLHFPNLNLCTSCRHYVYFWTCYLCISWSYYYVRS
jgi:hypothetical protein